MNTALPKLSVGLPVYNGEQYVAQAIECYLGQSFGDFDLIISDNASIDATEQICRKYAEKDSRIRYSRNEKNLGAGPNLNRVFQVSRPTAYFKWTAADDLYDSKYLELCMAALENDPTIVLAHTRGEVIDDSGRQMNVVGAPEGHYARAFTTGINGHVARWEDHYDRTRKLDSPSAPERFREILIHTRRCFEIWGVMRRAAIEKTHLHESFYGSDKVMLSALALVGRFVELPDLLYFRRHHEGSSDSIRSARAREAWMDTSRQRKRVSTSRVQCLRGYHRSLRESSVGPLDRVRCYGTLTRYLLRGDRWMAMLREPR